MNTFDLLGATIHESEVFFVINLTFDWQIDEFMVFCRSRQLREKTMASYEQTLRLFERWCNEYLNINTVDKVSESVIRRYLTDLLERGKYTFYANEQSKRSNCPERRRDYRKPISTATVNNTIRNLRVFFNWMERDYTIQRNPMKKVQQIKTNRKAKEYLTDEEFRRLISNLDKSYFPEHRDYAMINLMIDSGMRLGECTCILMEDLNLAKHSILLRAEITKGRKDRVVYFSAKTETILRRWIQFKDRYKETDYLFPTKASGDKVSIRGFESNFKHYLQRAKLNDRISPHCLRNNFAKRCLLSGMDIYTLSRLLGHSSVTVTEQAYLDLTDEDIGKRYQHYSPIANM